jgi:hypothetical protein
MQVITERQALEMYDESLDSEGPLTLAGLTYSRSYVLREVDPVAYREGFNGFVDYLYEDEVYVEGITDEDIEPDCDDSDDGYALASAGYGTDEDYGYAGDEY